MDKPSCMFADCERPIYRGRWCSGHYRQHRKGQELKPLLIRGQSEVRTCPCGQEFKVRAAYLKAGAGKHCSVACRAKYKLTDDSGYQALHAWVRSHYGPPAECSVCGTLEGRIEWANLSREYRRDRDDWAPMCKRCHVRHDVPPDRCRRGHERNAASTWVDSKGFQHCRTCRNERLRMQRQGKRAEWDAAAPPNAMERAFGAR